MKDIEIWIDIKGYEGIYQVSSYGNVRSLKYDKCRILKPFNCGGYYNVDLCKNCVEDYRRIHRLVAEAFIENDDKNNKTYINHIDGNKHNNHISNLEWCTASYNTKHAYDTGLAPRHATEQNQPYQIRIKEIVSNKEYFSIRECVRQLKINRDTIRRSLDLNTYVKNGTMKFEYMKEK